MNYFSYFAFNFYNPKNSFWFFSLQLVAKYIATCILNFSFMKLILPFHGITVTKLIPGYYGTVQWFG